MQNCAELVEYIYSMQQMFESEAVAKPWVLDMTKGDYQIFLRLFDALGSYATPYSNLNAIEQDIPGVLGKILDTYITCAEFTDT